MIHAVREGFFVLANDQIQTPLPCQPVTILDHLRDLIAGVDVNKREWDVPEKGFSGQPQENRGIFTHGPEHGQIIEMLISLTKDKHALVLELP